MLSYGGRASTLPATPGTFRYTAPPPWNNGLARTAVHNTILVDGQEQMTRAGRFLWLDWAQARVDPQEPSKQIFTAQHTGYQRLGITHQRTLTCIPGSGWQIKDSLLSVKTEETQHPHEIILHWLLPDLPWQITGNQLTFHTDTGQAILKINAFSGKERITESIQIIRAGEVIHGAPASMPTHGWISPTYATKKPALSILVSLNTCLPAQFLSEWQLSPQKALSSTNVNQQLT